MFTAIHHVVVGEQLGRGAAAGLLLKVDVGERLPVGIADDEAGILRGDPRRGLIRPE